MIYLVLLYAIQCVTIYSKSPKVFDTILTHSLLASSFEVSLSSLPLIILAEH